MDNISISISRELSDICRTCGDFGFNIRELLAKQIWNSNDRQVLLDYLSQLLTNSEYSVAVINSCYLLLLDLLHRAKKHVLGVGSEPCKQFYVTLSKLISHSPAVRRFVSSYLQSTNSSLLQDYGEISDEPVAKRRRNDGVQDEQKQVPLAAMLEAALRLVLNSVYGGKELDCCIHILQHVDSSNPVIRWCTLHCLAHTLQLSAAQLHSLRTMLFSYEELHNLILWHDGVIDNSGNYLRPYAMCINDGLADIGAMSHTKQSIVGSDFCSEVQAICGVLLPKLSSSCQLQGGEPTTDLVAVPSTSSNLRRLAMAVNAGLPVLLQGPVGCGKTSLVEYLSHMTGRTTSPYLIKVQLGDQMDSKMLLGTYHCTDVPGQFVWRPGCLLSAVKHGYWILLEDLDCAPMDVVSLLVSLLETGTLSVPGHGDKVQASPDFRIFATRRVVMSSSGWHRQRGSSSDILDKLWSRITVDPLAEDELITIISARFPHLVKIAEKLVKIFMALSNHEFDSSSEEVNDENVTVQCQNRRKFLTHGLRPVSARDLVKWCSRLEQHVVKRRSQLTTDVVFVEAIDCFCASLPLSLGQLDQARLVGQLLNFSAAEVRHHCLQRQIAEPAIARNSDSVVIGREVLKRTRFQTASLHRAVSSKFSFTRPAVTLLERVAVAIGNNESVLLVGETGTGKTSAVQYLAELMCHKLHVINMNQQSDSMDLLGGFKPVELRAVIEPLKSDFEALVHESFPTSDNRQFLVNVETCFSRKSWNALFRLMKTPLEAAWKTFEAGSPQRLSWEDLGNRISKLQELVEQIKSAPPFQFVEGTLVKALKEGDWVLLDEINLAPAELLECLSGLLESTKGSVLLTERGDVEPVSRHRDFRLFACMNPATDVGKKDLPLGIRNRFTEFYVDELDNDSDLRLLVRTYLSGMSEVPVKGIVEFYQQVRQMASTALTDGTGRRPHFSLRTLCRALRQASKNVCGHTARSIYEAFCLSFLTQLSRSSYPEVDGLIRSRIFRKSLEMESLLHKPLPRPDGDRRYVLVEGYWIPQGPLEIPNEADNSYILTSSVHNNLRDLARIVSAGRLPVLLQGETSVGKTSLIKYLARLTGNVCHRINNHEHTDIQEYIGCYTASEKTGRLVFREGVLVKAMREGHWIILDELNLAPSDVLEALNRLLDDNRELRIPETQTIVKAKAEFLLFATQNPPGHYGGRKVLSRAFRNRFVELHFDEIPGNELVEILQKRCELPQSYSQILVQVMTELQKRRRASGLFTGKQGYMTLRDLFRWGERFRLATDVEKSNGKQLLAENGYMLLAGRVRHSSEQAEIIQVLDAAFGFKVDPQALFTLATGESADSVRHGRRSVAVPLTLPLLSRITSSALSGFDNIVWTYHMRRMAVLVEQALRFGEPVLLVGDTGCGKTTVCQMYATRQGHQLRSVNCNLHTESSDFLGGLRPARHRSQAANETAANRKYFEWVDGPLVEAMKCGTTFLIDEISLASDSVLERLNSVLEPERTLLLTERGTSSSNEAEQIVALPEFRVVATMNPGGDYGKKELSPALRNRFTEIWCPLSHDRCDLIDIVEHNLAQRGLSRYTSHGNICHHVAEAMLDFTEWLQQREFGRKFAVTVRDLLAWVDFVCLTTVGKGVDGQKLELSAAYVHGACIVFIDRLSLQVSSTTTSNARTESLEKLSSQTLNLFGNEFKFDLIGGNMKPTVVTDASNQQLFGIYPFFIESGVERIDAASSSFSFLAPSTYSNAIRVLRALQLPRPILLEGSPGVGKTSLVAALAKMSGHELVRINLSEQTDISDLFGADLPVEGGRSGEFAWRDGPFLAALRAGHWIVLDEMNLASQSVLEGLNACFDHRAEVFIPELSATFQVNRKSTRFFACQNPVFEGGGRKSLPSSFLNRFTQVYVDPLTANDLLMILKSAYPQLPETLLVSMVEFNQQMHDVVVVGGQWGRRGGPWEFNLRDLFRWSDLLVASQATGSYNCGEFVQLIYADRMRTAEDKANVIKLYEKVFGASLCTEFTSLHCNITYNSLQVGNTFLPRKTTNIGSKVSSRYPLRTLHHSLLPLKSLMKCIEMNWMAILVGAAGVGKTATVELLAQLTGNQLHVMSMNSATDTTELLGGFEQADVRRDLEQILAKLDELVRGVSSALLLVESKNINRRHLTDLRRLLSMWNEIHHVEQSGSGNTVTAKEEVFAVRRKISGLEHVIGILISIITEYKLHAFLQECSAQKNKLERLNGLLEQDPSLNCGGKFEWIDSILVKCLREGHWLLIDNVNFCSASVLDRLNALLESNGSLTISERGVIDGTVVTVKPHADFRLILSMDPHHGCELSRAMRNRGVEICILEEKVGDGHCYDLYDLRLLIHDRGVVSSKSADALIKLHGVICTTYANISSGNLFNTSHLLRAAELFTRWLEIGVSVEVAFYQTALDIYVRDVSDSSVSKEIRATVDQVLPQLTDCAKGSSTVGPDSSMCVVCPRPLPTADEWCQNEPIAAVCSSCAQFMHVLHQLTKELDVNDSQRSSDNKTAVTSSAISLVDMLPLAVRSLLATCPVGYWNVLIAYVKDQIRKMQTVNSQLTLNDVAAHNVHSGVPFLKCLPEVVCQLLEAVATHPNLLRIKEFSENVMCQKDDWSQFPIDWRWNPCLLRRLTGTAFKFGALTDVDGACRQLAGMCNVLYLSWELLKYQIVQNHTFEVVVSSSAASFCPTDAITLLHVAFTQANSMPRALNHPAVGFSTRFLVDFVSELTAFSTEIQTLDDDDMVEFLRRLDWLKRFFKLLCKPIHPRSNDECIAELSMHWNWLYEKLIVKTRRFGFKGSSRLDEIVRQLHLTLGFDCKAAKLQACIRRGIGTAAPFKNEVEAKCYSTARQLSRQLNLAETKEVDGGVDVTDVKLKLIGALASLYRSDDDDTVKDVVTCTDLLGSVLSSSSCSKDATETASSSLEPLFNWLSLHYESRVVIELLSSPAVKDRNCWQNYVRFKCSHTKADLMRLVPFSAVALSTHSAAIESVNSDCLFAHFSDLASCCTGSSTVEPAVTVASNVLSLSCFSLLTSHSSVQSNSTELPLSSTVTVGDCSTRLLQISTLNRMLWVNSCLIDGPQCDFFRNNFNLFVIVLRRVCGVLFNQEFSDEMHQAIAASSSPDVLADQLKSLIGKQDELESSLLTSLLPGWKLQLVACLNCLEKVQTADTDDNGHHHRMACLGEAWVHLGMLQSCILAPCGPVDPSYQHAVRLKYAREDVEQIKLEIEQQNWRETLATGSKVNVDSAHPLIVSLYSRQKKLEQLIARKTEMLAFRSEPMQYVRMLQDIRRFIGGIGSTERVFALMGRLWSAFDDVTAVRSVLNEQQTFYKSVQSFLQRIEVEYADYRDLTMPFLCGITETVFGLNLLAEALQQKTAKVDILNQISLPDIDSIVRAVGSVLSTSPCSDLQQCIPVIVSDEVQRLVHFVSLTGASSAPAAADMQSRLVQSALFHVSNYTMESGNLNSWTLSQLRSIFDRYASLWHQMEQSRLQRELEEKSLYRYRTETFGDSLTEEQRDENQIKSRFPSFYDDFEGVINQAFFPNNGESTASSSADSQLQAATQQDINSFELDPEEMVTVYSIHSVLFKNLVSSNWYCADSAQLPKPGYLKPILLRYPVLSCLVKQLSGVLDPSVEKDLLAMHLVACSSIYNVTDPDSVNQQLYANKTYDIYRDSNVAEVVKCRTVLDELVQRVRQLLVEFPDWPTLVQITGVVDRIRSFSLTSPLMRFVTGLEMVIEVCLMWDRDAATSFKLTKQLEPIVELVKQWRSIEYRCWKSCLNTVFDDVRRNVSRWWFHLYNLLEPYIGQSTEQSESDQRQYLRDLLHALETFMESSPAGEFSYRLEMLLTFHCHIIAVKRDASSGGICDKIANLFWNIHQYYGQFAANVDDFIGKTRTTVEKSIKGTVASIPWIRRNSSVLNYDVTKSEIHKVHKSLHRDMKAFQQHLQHPVGPLLTDTEADTDVLLKQWHSKISTVPTCYVFRQQDLTGEHDKTLSKYWCRMSKFIQQVMTKCKYTGHINNLDSFTGEIISGVHELQSLKVDETKTKEKQKSEAKHIVHRKRKALSDLFHLLESTGLSFKTGLNKLNGDDGDKMLKTFTIEPSNVVGALRQLQPENMDDWTCGVVDKTNEYFVRCVCRRRLFHTSLQTPSKELEHGTIERCRGFSEHLACEVERQRRMAAKYVDSFVTLRKRLEVLTHLNKEQSHQLPPQNVVRDLLESLKQTVDEVLQRLHHIKLVVSCAPNSETSLNNVNVPLSPAQLTSLSAMSLIARGDPQWSVACETIQEAILAVKSVQTSVNSGSVNCQIITSVDMTALLSYAAQLKTVADRLSRLADEFRNPETGKLWFVGSAISYVSSRLLFCVEKFGAIQTGSSEEKLEAQSECERHETDNISRQFNRVKESIMLVVQALYKKMLSAQHHKDKDVEVSTPEDLDDDEVGGLEDNLITNVLGKDLCDELKLLKIHQISRSLDALIKMVDDKSDRSSRVVRCLCDLVPAVKLYCQLVQFFVTHHIAAARASAKLLNVLLAIFAGLAQKGFCSPAEFSDEMEGEGCTKFEDIQGGGLGEGEGAKDVSDQIESEDQLEDSRKASAGAEKEQEKPDNKEEIPSEDNAIEMTDDFDGRLHDADRTGDDDDQKSEEESDLDETELDQQMGDLGNEECDKLDEKMWDAEGEDEEIPQNDKEELGPGSGQQSQPELAAKDDTGDRPQNQKDDKKPDDVNNEAPQPQPQCPDESEYDESEPTAAPPDLPAPPADDVQMDLPDDMNIGDNDEDNQEEAVADDGNDEADLNKQLEENLESETATENKNDESVADEPMEQEPDKNAEVEESKEPDNDSNDQSAQNENTDSREQETEEGNPTDQTGSQAQIDEREDVADENPDMQDKNTDKVIGTEHDTTDVQQIETAEGVAGTSDQPDDKQEGCGISSADDKGHEGANSSTVTAGLSGQDRRRLQRRPGTSSENRDVGNADERIEKNLQTIDDVTSEENDPKKSMDQQKSNLYEHIRDSSTRHDAQTLDAATENQQQTLQRPTEDQEMTEDKDIHADEDFLANKDSKEDNIKGLENLKPEASKASKQAASNLKENDAMDIEEQDKTESSNGDVVLTHDVERGPVSTIHTNLELLSLRDGNVSLDYMRQIVEDELHTLPRGTPDEEREAQILWQHYDALTSTLSQELCEQLRMVLAPTLAAKFKGGYRTGKRPCMRRVIEYIASDFRKDKFWLRRVEPSKRQYQIMVAIDDSASMVFNHSKQLAFESLSVITNALTKLEVGNIGVCSFGQTTKIMHRLGDTFTAESGARILHLLSFEQQQTNIVQLLETMTEQLIGSSHQLHQAGTGGIETSQLLLIISDGRCLGDRSKVKAAVRRACEAQIFLVFVVLDNPGKEDIFKMTLFEYEENAKAGKKVMKLSNYMESFPFPFYVVIRDVASLPLTLSDALRQWFELVTAVDH